MAPLGKFIALRAFNVLKEALWWYDEFNGIDKYLLQLIKIDPEIFFSRFKAN